MTAVDGPDWRSPAGVRTVVPDNALARDLPLRFLTKPFRADAVLGDSTAPPFGLGRKRQSLEPEIERCDPGLGADLLKVRDGWLADLLIADLNPAFIAPED